MELLSDLFRGSSTQTVEDVVVPLLWALCAYPGLLQQVVGNKPAHDGVLPRSKATINLFSPHILLLLLSAATGVLSCLKNKKIKQTEL